MAFPCSKKVCFLTCKSFSFVVSCIIDDVVPIAALVWPSPLWTDLSSSSRSLSVPEMEKVMYYHCLNTNFGVKRVRKEGGVVDKHDQSQASSSKIFYDRSDPNLRRFRHSWRNSSQSSKNVWKVKIWGMIKSKLDKSRSRCPKSCSRALAE